MRFSSSSILVSLLPLLGAAQEFEQYKAQFQNFLGQFGSYLPNPNKHDPIGAAEAKIGEMKMDVLTLNNWRETLYSPVRPEATTPEEWWVFITGRNKTCFGRLAPLNRSLVLRLLRPGGSRLTAVLCVRPLSTC